MNLKAKIEAVLFLTAKPIKAQAMARIVNADVQSVRQALLELVHDYEERKGGLEISDEDGYSFQVKDEYANLMDEFLPVEMSAALIRTLSAIAIKQPIAQSEIIRVRGAGAYDHIRELVNRELVAKKEEQGGGRSPMLSTTKKFQEYFRLTKDGKDLRNYLKGQVKKAAQAAEAAAAGQLSIGVPEADDQLNNRIFLETADMSDAAEEAMDATPYGEVETQVTAEHGGIDIPPPPGDDAQPAAPAAEVILEQEPQDVQPQVVEPVAVEAPVVAVEVAVAETTVAEATVVEPQPEASTTLSKLAAAAVAKEPEPAPVIEMEDAPTVAPATDDAAQSAGSSKSTVQAHSAKDGPAMGNNKPKKKPPSGLSELLKKQKDLEKALKMATEAEDAEQTVIDFTKLSDTTPPIDKTLPS